MASRHHIKTQSELLKAELRAACRENRLRPGDAVSPLRQLCTDFELSHPVVMAVLRELCEEGLLHTVERTGTFAGPPRPKKRPLFAFFNVASELQYSISLKNGFETRIAALGGGVITMSKQQGRQMLRESRFPDCAGVFEMSLGIEDTLREFAENEGLAVRTPLVKAHVVFGGSANFFDAAHDSVAFDDESGGRLATEHLISQGHERIAFLGVHQNPQQVAPALTEPKWSRDRQIGWQSALQNAGLGSEDLAFYAHSSWGKDCSPAQTILPTEREPVADFLLALQNLFGTSEAISAVVTGNDHMASLLFSQLQRIQWPHESWPVVISFDGDLSLENEVVSSLNLPWDKIGRAAAELLWERSQGILTGAPVHRAVPMTLIPRLSCRTDWNTLAMAS